MAEMYSDRVITADYDTDGHTNPSLVSRVFNRFFGLFHNATNRAKCDQTTGLLRCSDAELAVRGMTRRKIYEHVYMDDTR